MSQYVTDVLPSQVLDFNLSVTRWAGSDTHYDSLIVVLLIVWQEGHPSLQEMHLAIQMVTAEHEAC